MLRQAGPAAGAPRAAAPGLPLQVGKYAGDKRLEKLVTDALEWGAGDDAGGYPPGTAAEGLRGGRAATPPPPTRQQQQQQASLPNQAAAQITPQGASSCRVPLPSAVRAPRLCHAGDTDARLAAGLLLRELLRAAPERLQPHLAALLPAAFIARMDADAGVAGCWADVRPPGRLRLDCCPAAPLPCCLPPPAIGAPALWAGSAQRRAGDLHTARRPRGPACVPTCSATAAS
jgi:hypothetical protein